MLRRSLIKSVPAVAGASLITGTSIVTPRLVMAANAAKDHDHDLSFKLFPVYGKARIKIYIEYYYPILLKAKFVSLIFVKDFYCEEGSGRVDLEGYISAKFFDIERKHRDTIVIDLKLDKVPFEAGADIYKDEWDDWDDKGGKDRNDRDKKLVLDIDKFEVEKKIDYPKKIVIKYWLDPDPVKLDPRKIGYDVFEELKKCVEDDHHRQASR
jgi:hypothetical protein